MICTVDVECLSGCLSAYQGWESSSAKGKPSFKLFTYSISIWSAPQKTQPTAQKKGRGFVYKEEQSRPRNSGPEQRCGREKCCRDNQLLTPNPGGLLLAPRDLVSRTKLKFRGKQSAQLRQHNLYIQASSMGPLMFSNVLLSTPRPEQRKYAYVAYIVRHFTRPKKLVHALT